MPQTEKQVMRLSQLTADLRKYAEETRKSASEQERLANQSIPGDEKNKAQAVPAPEALGLSGKETDMVPASAQPSGTDAPAGGTDTATPGEAPVVAGQSAGVAPEQVPLTKGTIDQKAAEVSALANQLSARILEHNAKVQKQAAAAPAAPAPAAAPAAVVAAPAPENKAAGSDAFDLELTSDVLAKIAAIVCSTADGAAFVEEKIAEYIGAQEAQGWMSFLASQNAEAEKTAAAEAEQYAAGVKTAEELIALAQDPYFKQGQMMGMDSLGMDPAALEAAAPEGVTDEGGDAITPEDVVGALELMVSSGELEPEQAAELLQSIMDGGDAAPEATPAEVSQPAPDAAPAAAESVPAEAAADKTASADTRSQILQHFQGFKRTA